MKTVVAIVAAVVTFAAAFPTLHPQQIHWRVVRRIVKVNIRLVAMKKAEEVISLKEFPADMYSSLAQLC
jgi:hypothetical protein